MMVCVRVSFMSEPKPSANGKSELQTSKNPSSENLLGIAEAPAAWPRQLWQPPRAYGTDQPRTF